MTDAAVEQQEESKWRRDHAEVPHAADSSSSSSSNESSTDTEMGLVDVGDGKLVAVFAEGREDGPITLFVKCDFIKAGSRTNAENWLRTRNRCC